MPKKKLFLIDGNSFCYRAYYAIRMLSNSKGQPTNAIYGFVSILQKLVKENRPDMIAAAFDLKGPTFRHEKFEDYKVHRKPMPDDLVSQMPHIKEVVRAYNIPIYELQGYEADDVLATIATQAADKGIEVYIVTGDKDALQLVDDHIRVLNTNKEIVYDSAKVQEVYGVAPDKMVDIMGLMGDASDNIPGVQGIGEKTAVELIKEFGSIDGLYKNLDKVKGEARKRTLRENEDRARLSRELAVVDVKVPIAIDFDGLVIREPDSVRLYELFREFEFKSLTKEFAPRETLSASYELVKDGGRFEWLIGELAASREFAFDFETTSEDPIRAELVGVSFSWEKGKAYYVPVNAYFTCGEVVAKLKPLFEDASLKKIGQNIKYEYIVLSNYGVKLRGIAFDTMVASYLVNPSKLTHNLDDISIEFLNHKLTTPIEALIGKGKSAITMDKVDVDKVCAYCCEDSDVTFRLKTVLAGELAARGLGDLYNKVEIPLIEVLAEMERAGVSVDSAYLGTLSSEMEKKLDVLTHAIYNVAGEEFNINSPKQLSRILFEKFKLPVVRRTKTGISTDESVLTKLADKHELPKKLLEFRELAKLKSTYVDALPALVDSKTRRLHTSFNQTVTATGRLSSSNPNLQNIPIKTEEGRKIRRAFIPSEKNGVLLSADYSQIELRVLAHLSGDANLVKAFRDRLDIHTYTASLVYGVPEDAVTPEMRSAAKTVNFGIIYGMSPYGLSQGLGIEVDKAKAFIDAYFQRYPGVKAFLDSMVEEARVNGYAVTLLGRRRDIPEINSTDVRLRQFAERTAVNTPIQGTAADIIKIAMIRISEQFSRDRIASKMIMQVHDELVFDVVRGESEKVYSIVKTGMEDVVALKVPIEAHIEAGPNWLDSEPYGG